MSDATESETAESAESAGQVSVRAWDPATATDPVEDMRTMAELIRSGDFPDRSAERAAEEVTVIGRAMAAMDVAPLWAYGPVGAEAARAMLWFAVEVLAGVEDVDERVRVVAAENSRRFADRAAGARQALGVLGSHAGLLAEIHEQQERLLVESLTDERAAVQLLTVVRQVAGMSPAARAERQLLGGVVSVGEDRPDVARVGSSVTESPSPAIQEA